MTDVDGFEAFVLRFQDMVFATAYRLLGRQEDAEDVAQTVFLRAFERFDQLRESPAAPGWLKTVATNLCLNHLSRHRSRWRLFSEMGRQDEAGDVAPFEATIAAPETPDVLETAATETALEQAVSRLPAHQRVPIVLYHYEDKSYQEIASLLGISLGKLKTDIHRGREALKKYVGAHA